MLSIDGRALSKEIKTEIREEVDRIRANNGNIPHLAAVIVGDNPASESYVKNKVKSSDEVGFESTVIKKDENISEEELIEIIHGLNNNSDVDGFIVQLPLPRHIDPDKITLAIDPAKDVDGFHPYNFGRMALGIETYLPATPYGIVMMLDRYNISTEGKQVVVVGRSNIVGMPISIMLAKKGKVGNATVTITHSRTKNLEAQLKKADIIIAAIGRANYIKAEHIKEGAVVIDVGINRVQDESRKRGYRLVGDVDYEDIKSKASYATPVPGGVGPMTVTALLMNTLKASKNKSK